MSGVVVDIKNRFVKILVNLSVCILKFLEKFILEILFMKFFEWMMFLSVIVIVFLLFFCLNGIRESKFKVFFVDWDLDWILWVKFGLL